MVIRGHRSAFLCSLFPQNKKTIEFLPHNEHYEVNE